jgi:hypothetical protein
MLPLYIHIFLLFDYMLHQITIMLHVVKMTCFDSYCTEGINCTNPFIPGNNVEKISDRIVP